MKNTLRLAALVFFGFALFQMVTSISVAQAGAVASVDSMVFAKAVESREPIGVSKEFDGSVAQVFCWTKLSTQARPVTVRHVWYKGGQKLLEVPLTLKHASGRYWSVKNVTPGDWKVEVVSDTGEVLSSGSFRVK
jgi:hypothetical protein